VDKNRGHVLKVGKYNQYVSSLAVDRN